MTPEEQALQQRPITNFRVRRRRRGSAVYLELNYQIAELDPRSDLLWRHCDGHHTVLDLIHRMRTDANLSEEKATVAVIAGLTTLSQKGLLFLDVGQSR